MERRRVTIDNIHVGSRHREPDMAKVREIAKSITDVGLMNPPAVMFRDGIVVDGEELENVPVLIYGRHRLLALQELGEVMVECIVHDVDDLHAELMEIDENLARAELSPAQEAAHIARRKEIWEELKAGENSETNCTTIPRDRGRPKEFAAELAEVTGSSKVDINRKLRRVDTLGPDIHRIAGTSLDKGVEMDALIKLPEQDRKELIERAASGETVSARPPPPPKPITTERALVQMTRDLEARAESYDGEADRIAEEIIDRYGEDEMPFLLNFLIPKIAAAVRRRL